MGKLKKIFKTVIIFILIMLGICFTCSVFKFLQGEIVLHEILPKTGLYFLYTIGYGALEEDAFLQNFFAMIGIISIALMSTFLTLNLFWRFDDVLLQKKVDFDFSNQRFFFHFTNKGKTICNMKASFLLYDTLTNEGIEGPREYFMPLLLENASWNISLSLEETFWYDAFLSILRNDAKHLYCTFSFVDTKSGQESIRVEEILPSYCQNERKEALTVNMIQQPIFIRTANLKMIENGTKLQLSHSKKMSTLAYQQLNQVKDFMMVYYSFRQHPLNLEKYKSSDTYLTFGIQSSKKLQLDLEIKTLDQAQFTYPIQVQPEKTEIKIFVKEIPLYLEQVHEICFIIRKKGNLNANEMTLTDIQIHVC